MVGSNARLQIDNQTTDKTVLDIPLIDYLVMRSEAYMNWSDQEYLDREMNYTLILFLDANNQWVTSTIIINGWTVRINNI